MDKYKITSVTDTPAGVLITVESDRLNDVREFLMSAECRSSLPYNEGDRIGDAELAEIEEEAAFCRAFAAGLRILSYSSHSKNALVRKLCQKGFPKDTAERAADYAADTGALDEEKEASSIADYAIRHKYWGKKRIAADLMQKGYSRSAVAAALEKINSDVYAENLARLLEKKPIPSDRAGRDKYIAALCRLGYSLQEILRAVKDFENEQ